MRRFRLLGLVLLSVFAVGVVVSSALALLPVNLPKQKTWTGKGDGGVIPKLFSLSGTIECEKDGATTAEGTEDAATTESLGLFHIHFLGCKNPSTGLSCNSLGDEKGAILTLGSWHLVWDTLKPALGDAILFLPEHLHLECTALLLVLVLGSLVCLLLEAGSLKASHLFHCIVKKETEDLQEETHWWNNAGVEQTGQLLCSVNGGKEENCSELALGEVTYKEANSVENL